jgi:hypothetical protein
LLRDVLRFPFYLIVHPFNGYWELKYEEKGFLRVSLAILLLYAFTSVLQRQYSGFVVNYNKLNELNSVKEVAYIVLPFILWSVSNWSLTTLMGGEGKFREIVIATGYALLPPILINLPMIMFSNVITREESSFYYFFLSVSSLWFLYLLFVGTMTIHQYTVTKTLVTIGLTLVVMGIIIFLGLLFFSLVQQVVNFCTTIYQELVLRL